MQTPLNKIGTIARVCTLVFGQLLFRCRYGGVSSMLDWNGCSLGILLHTQWLKVCPSCCVVVLHGCGRGCGGGGVGGLVRLRSQVLSFVPVMLSQLSSLCPVCGVCLLLWCVLLSMRS